MMFVIDLAEGAGVDDVAGLPWRPRHDARPARRLSSSPGAGIAAHRAGERVGWNSACRPANILVGCPIPDVAAIFAGEMPLSHIEHGMVKMINVVE